MVFVNVESAECLAQVIKEDKLDTRLVVFGELTGFEDVSLKSILQSQDIVLPIDEFECVKLTSPDQIATIVCSSGTSGFPKGTEISHASMINYMNHVKIHDLRGHVSMWTPSMRWYCGLFIVIKAILDCSKRIIVPDCDDDEMLCHYIEMYKASEQRITISLVPWITVELRPCNSSQQAFIIIIIIIMSELIKLIKFAIKQFCPAPRMPT